MNPSKYLRVIHNKDISARGVLAFAADSLYTIDSSLCAQHAYRPEVQCQTTSFSIQWSYLNKSEMPDRCSLPESVRRTEEFSTWINIRRAHGKPKCWCLMKISQRRFINKQWSIFFSLMVPAVHFSSFIFISCFYVYMLGIWQMFFSGASGSYLVLRIYPSSRAGKSEWSYKWYMLWM